jgi:anthranilate/para-aminobenzoate synthase component II
MILLIDNMHVSRPSRCIRNLVQLFRQYKIDYRVIKTVEDYNEIPKNIVRGIILSGSPMRITQKIEIEKVAASIEAFTQFPRVPIMGICFGLQLMNIVYGGTVKPFGRPVCRKIDIDEKCRRIFFCFNDVIDKVASGFNVKGTVRIDGKEVITHIEKPKRTGLLFHPEYNMDKCGYIAQFLKQCNIIE